MNKCNVSSLPPQNYWPELYSNKPALKSKKLSDWWKLLKQNGTKCILVIHENQIVFERYAKDHDRYTPHYTASLAKALTGGMSLLFAIQDGLIKFDDPVWKYVSQWKNDPIKSQITVLHLATHTSGLEDSSVDGFQHTTEPGIKGEFWKRNPVPQDPFTISRDKIPVTFKPGHKYQYSNPGIAMLAYCVTKTLQKSPHKDIRTLLKDRLMDPIEVPRSEWKCGYDQTFIVDDLPLVGTWGGGKYSARATASIIRLLLRKGSWGNNQLLKATVVEDAFKNAGLPPNFHGHAWWVNSDGKGNRHHNCLPDDAFWGFGAGFQIGLGIPSMNLVMVRYGEDPVEIKKATQKKRWPSEKLRDLTTSRVIFSPLNNSITVHLPPYPPSKKITSCTWDHISKVRRFAGGGSFRDGSDNWPITWANDNNLYTAYGDGYGFPPYIPNKLGMGFVKIEGNSENFTAINIRSDAENTSYGPTGKKASGILSINKTLYILARNDNKNGKYSRLGWTTDHTRTFQWCKWNFKEFGHPTFINFGKNYEGARDKFVYIWSNNHPSAYESSDHFVLARVPKSQILDRHCYEFFVTLRDKNPVWSKDINKRGPVFKFPGNCMRSSISYNKGLKRYILWQNIRTSATVDTRYKGGFGIFEAPQPWGKWRTIFFTNKWDIGPGELGCFPTKWMKKDGKSMTLVCSSDDQFTVRKVILAVR